MHIFTSCAHVGDFGSQLDDFCDFTTPLHRFGHSWPAGLSYVGLLGSSFYYPSCTVCTFSLCCQIGTKLIPGRNQGSDGSRSYAKRKFQIMLSSWNQADPRLEPSSKCHHSYTICSLSLAAPSPIIILNKRWCGHLGHQLEKIRGPGSPHPFI